MLLEFSEHKGGIELDSVKKIKILFCKIGWSRNYRGDSDDNPVGGGSYNKEHIGHETLNMNCLLSKGAVRINSENYFFKSIRNAVFVG